MNIMVVDDEKVQLETLTRGLTRYGHRVFQAGNGQEALDILHDPAQDIDVVLTDFAMPVTDGVELLEKIRQTYRSIPVFLMSAYKLEDLETNAIELKCQGVLEKPFTLKDLIRELTGVGSPDQEDNTGWGKCQDRLMDWGVNGPAGSYDSK